MLPDIPKFRDSLLALSLVEVPADRPPDQPLSVVVCKKIRRMSPDRLAEDKTEIVLQQKPEAPIALPRLIDRFAEELQALGHAHVQSGGKHREGIAARILALYSVTRQVNGDPMNDVNKLLAAISPARVAQ